MNSYIFFEMVKCKTQLRISEKCAKMSDINQEAKWADSPPPSPGLDQVEPLLERLEGYTPTVSDATVQAILAQTGLKTQDPQVTRLISVAAQKFISDIAYDALQHCKMRGGGKEQKKVSGRDKKFALATEDVAVALSDQGITVKKPQYYTN